MKYRRLGSTDLLVSVVGLGTWQFGGEWGRPYTQPDADAILDKSRRVRHEPDRYGRMLWRPSLRGADRDYLARHDRSRWIVATKFGHQFHAFMDRTWHLKTVEVAQQLEASLRALKTDYIDIYQFHSGFDPEFQQPDLWDMLQNQKRAGRVRHLGISISSKSGDLQARLAKQVGAESPPSYLQPSRATSGTGLLSPCHSAGSWGAGPNSAIEWIFERQVHKRWTLPGQRYALDHRAGQDSEVVERSRPDPGKGTAARRSHGAMGFGLVFE